ncbi:MAG TPA: amino acid permease [Deltaproteobacteria bacterium]|nr:amino acid permease [Deltaproteobacteria bacterium]
MTGPGGPGLRRRLSLFQVTLYGLGTTVGAGIYLLIGEVVKVAGMAAPSAFLVASILAAFTAFSFGELVSRFPESAGEAAYVEAGWGSRTLATLVGLGVALAGSISAAAMAVGFAGYLSEFVTWPEPVVVTCFVGLMMGIAAWGIGESVSIAGLFTLIEVGGLAVVIWVARESLAALPAHWGELVPLFRPHAWRGVGAASLLTFYAYLGFEDMVNVAEEVKGARRTLPLAIAITLSVTTALYGLLAAVAVLIAPPAELAASRAPLAFLYERATGTPATGIAVVGTLAVVNGALIQMIMASRVVYGLAARGHLPGVLARVSDRRGTPVVATSAVGALVLVLALWLPLAPLAEGTSIVTLLVFVAVNLSLLRIKRRPEAGAPPFSVPRWVPLAGACSAAALLSIRFAETFRG